MLSETEFEILASFFPKLEEKTLKEIEKSVGLSHEPTFRNLKSLAKNGHLKEKKVGKTNVYEFIFTDYTYLIYNYFMTKKIHIFKKKHSLLYRRLKEFSSLIVSDLIILFGSYAKGIETKKSDIDMLIVSDKTGIEKTAATFKTKYNIIINPVVVRVKDFKNIKKDNKTFYSDLIEFGIVLEGLEFFFKEVYKNEKND